MEKITRHNYEAFFLDFLEGGLSDERNLELKVFLIENPDLAAELEDFENVSLEPESTSSTWHDLKVPTMEDLVKSESLREQLYFKSIEAQANDYDKKLLAELVCDDQFKEEYALWSKVRLESTDETVEREGLFRLPLVLPITPQNYEDFLIGRTERILSEEENLALESYAARIEDGEKDFALADSLRLEAPKGVFYPFKKELRKKKKSFVLFYRAAAVLLLFGLSASLFILLNPRENPNSRYAQRELVQSPDDSLKGSDSQKGVIEDSISKVNKTKRYQLEEWEVREPDPFFVADQLEPIIKKEIVPQEPSLPDEFDEVEYAEAKSTENVVQEQIQLHEPNVESRDEDEMILAEEIPKVEYKTIGEIAQNRVADQLNLSDSEKDELALSVAKRITQKAGEALDSELKKEVDEDGDRLTYSLRIRGFKVSHSTSK